LKAEQNKLKKIAKNDKGEMLSITDIPGITSTFKRMAEVDPSKAEEIKKYQKSLKEHVERALRNNQGYLHENIKVNGKSLKYYSIKEIKKLMMEANSTKIMLTNKLKDSALNESLETKRSLKSKIANKIRLISLLDEELTYRVTRKNCLAKLNEDEDTEDKGSNGDFSEEDLTNMFGGNQGDNEKDDNAGDDEEVVDLARIVITMEDKDAAEELKKSCIDAGIPEDVIEIEEAEEEESEESEEDTESEESEKSEKSEEKEQPNESVKYKNLKRLFEDEEAEDSDDAEDDSDDAEDDDNSDDTEDEEKEGAVKFILTDTDYVKNLAKVLDDEYGISKEEFEEMIGGEIVDEDESDDSDEEATEEDSEKEEKKSDDSDEDAPEDDIDPAELFKGL